MHKEKHYKGQLILFLFGELSTEKAGEIEAHLRLCSECREELKKYEKICQLMDKRSYIEPPSQYWNYYWQKLRPKLKEGKFSRWQNYILLFRQHRYPRWSIIAATSALLLIVGISVFWFFKARNITQSTETTLPLISQQKESPLTATYVNRAANEYLNEVKPLLLEVANRQPTPLVEWGLDFSLEKKLSQQLLLQNRLLRREAGSSFDPQLQSLFEDIELVLTDISNLQEKNDGPSIDFIKENIGDLPIKIDLFASKLKK